MAAPKILVIDDQPINVQLLKRKLEREGIQVVAAYNGRDGLEKIKQERPDLVLLDVMMPDMDGIEVCQRLQADEETRPIPVIFITARTTKESKLEGLGVGAVDYITKPIDLDETLARVQTQLRFVAINREMVDLQRRLEEARRAATIGAVTQGISHNLNNLLGVAIGYLDLIKVSGDKPEQVRNCVAQIDTALQRIVSIIRQLGSLVVKAQPPLAKARLSDLLAGGVARFHHDFRLTAPVLIENTLPDLEIETNTELLEEMLSKILINAWEAYDSAAGEARPITIHTRLIDRAADGQSAEIRIDDQGRGIDPALRDQLFEPFISSKNTVGVGMGLTVARHAIRNLGGEVTVVDRPGGGASTILLHPVLRKEPALDDPEAEAYARSLPL
jgi:two-component system, sensor histidine kinase and response regulator